MDHAGNHPGVATVEVGVYVHFPFCRSRCPYCDFATVARAALPHEEYAQAVLAELAARAPAYRGRRLRSIYLGGGTPGLWRPDRVVAVTAAAAAAFGARPTDLEVTLEANPGDLAQVDLDRLRAGGVSRLSLGIQSLDDDELRLLGRRGDRAGALAAIARARAAGFDNLSCDLIFALPGQTLGRLGATLDEMCGLRPEHVSVYNLTIEEDTPFGARAREGRLRLPDSGIQVEMYELCRERLAQAGYEHYEVSNFAQPDRAAVHNSLYWRGAEYLGLGAAAHSLHRTDEVALRTANPRDPEAYMVAALDGTLAPAERETLDRDAQRREALWLGLRMLEGIPRLDYLRQHGVDPTAVDPTACADLFQQGLLEVTPERLRLTRRGVLFADEVALRFL
jgi:oxygen-independent coproporphyrinogen-3 oxidase